MKNRSRSVLTYVAITLCFIFIVYERMFPEYFMNTTASRESFKMADWTCNADITTKISYFTQSQNSKDAEIKKRHEVGTYATKPVERCTQNERKKLLKFHCENEAQPPMTAKYFRHLFVDRKHKILACLPPKAGCTTWKTILANNSKINPLSSKYNMMALHNGLVSFGVLELSTFDPAEIDAILNGTEYTKFLITRHPFERIFSAYYDKLGSGKPNNMMSVHGSRILQIFRPNLHQNLVQKGVGVTFKEFIDYIKLPVSNDRSHQHWDAVYDVCQPCHVSYDYIIKTETMNKDNEDVIKQHFGPYYRGIGTAGNVMSSKLKYSRLLSLTPRGKVLKGYASLNQTDIEYLIDRFKNDFKYFGYSSTICHHENTMHSSCIHGSLDRHCC